MKEIINYLNENGIKGNIIHNPTPEKIKEIRKAMKIQQDIIDFRNGSDELSDITSW